MKQALRSIFIFAVCVTVAEPIARRLMGARYDALKAQTSALVRPLVDAALRVLESPESVLGELPTGGGPDGVPVAPPDGRTFLQRPEVTGEVDLERVRQQVAARARALVGTPYVWGGESDAGADCSGLVFLLYEQEGVRLPRRSRLLFRVTDRVAITDLRAGDLVFFHNSSGAAGHVGVYVGDDQVVHASSSRGRTVLDRLDSVAAHNGLTGVRRVLATAAKPVVAEL